VRVLLAAVRPGSAGQVRHRSPKQIAGIRSPHVWRPAFWLASSPIDGIPTGLQHPKGHFRATSKALPVNELWTVTELACEQLFTRHTCTITGHFGTLARGFDCLTA
jgi:hypothetical protein